MARFFRTYLMVTNLEASIRFYRDVLGLDVAEPGDDRATIGGDDPSLVLEEDFDVESLAAFGLEPPGEERGDGAILNVEVEDVDAVAERARENGTPVLSPPRDVDWTGRLTLLADPDGYVVEASQPEA